MKQATIQVPKLTSDYGDALLLGGLSVLFFIFVQAFPDQFQATLREPMLLLGLNTALNYPHVMASFLLFYRKGGNAKDHRLIAWVFPVLISLILVIGVAVPSPTLMSVMSQITLVAFFWHFLMQSLGCSLWLLASHGKVSSAVLHRYKIVTLTVAIGIGLTGYLSTHIYSVAETLIGIKISPVELPVLALRDGIAAFSLLCLCTHALYTLFLGWKNRSPFFTFTAVLPILALYFWFAPQYVFSPFRPLILYFHSLQFFIFFRRAQTVQTEGDPGPVVFKHYFPVWLVCAVVGFFLMYVVPRSLSGSLSLEASVKPLTQVMTAFVIFFNLQHYLMDGTLWRLRSERNRARLGIFSN